LNEDLQLGQIVRSKAGRDRGKWFAVVGLEGDAFVYLADGKTRSTEKPKLKKIRHIAKTNSISPEISEALRNHATVSDELVKRVLSKFPEITAKKERDIH